LAGETEVLGENLPHAALSTTNPTCCPDANPGRRGGKPATNRLSYGTAIIGTLSKYIRKNEMDITFICRFFK
jgi:hypothetical protein